MNTGGRATCALMTAAVLIGLSGCSDASPQPTVPTTTTARKPITEDGGLRDVRMTSGRALGFVQPETASQILCHSLDKDEWKALLGGSVGRRPFVGADGGCTVTTAEGEELPDIDDDGKVRFVETPLTGDLVDLPIPV